MRKFLFIIAAICICILPLCACDAREVPEEVQAGTLVVASSYPIYALTDAVVRDVPNMHLRCLIQPQDGCIRRYTLSEWDVSLLSLADIVVIGGRGLEQFESALKNLGDGGPVVITAMSGLALSGEAQAVFEEDDSHFDGANPWLFLSVEGARDIVEQISANFCYLDPENEPIYTENMRGMFETLDQLKAEMAALLEGRTDAPVALLHEGLSYFADEFSLNVHSIVRREPLQDFDPQAFAALTEELKQGGVKIVIMEHQAPTRLKADFEASGLIVCEFDTLTAHMPYGGQDGYAASMLKNAHALADAYARISAVE